MKKDLTLAHKKAQCLCQGCAAVGGNADVDSRKGSCVLSFNALFLISVVGWRHLILPKEKFIFPVIFRSEKWNESLTASV